MVSLFFGVTVFSPVDGEGRFLPVVFSFSLYFLLLGIAFIVKAASIIRVGQNIAERIQECRQGLHTPYTKCSPMSPPIADKLIFLIFAVFQFPGPVWRMLFFLVKETLPRRKGERQTFYWKSTSMLEAIVQVFRLN